jgi:hypothetical protein
MPAPIPSPVQGVFGFQFHQVAIFCPSGVGAAVKHWYDLGYTNWITDRAELKGKLRGVDVLTSATMMFNYDIMPMELEFLEYHGPSRHEGRLGEPFISHMSVYSDDVFRDTALLTQLLGQKPFHRFITQGHSNPGVQGKKRFIESIFDTQGILGYDTKLIQKVSHDYPDELWLGATNLDQEVRVAPRGPHGKCAARLHHIHTNDNCSPDCPTCHPEYPNRVDNHNHVGGPCLPDCPVYHN